MCCKEVYPKQLWFHAGVDFRKVCPVGSVVKPPVSGWFRREAGTSGRDNFSQNEIRKNVHGRNCPFNGSMKGCVLRFCADEVPKAVGPARRHSKWTKPVAEWLWGAENWTKNHDLVDMSAETSKVYLGWGAVSVKASAIDSSCSKSSPASRGILTEIRNHFGSFPTMTSLLIV